MEKVYKFSVRIFSHRYFPIGVVILAILLTLPALGVGLLIDDLYIREVILERETYTSI